MRPSFAPDLGYVQWKTGLFIAQSLRGFTAQDLLAGQIGGDADQKRDQDEHTDADRHGNEDAQPGQSRQQAQTDAGDRQRHAQADAQATSTLAEEEPAYRGVAGTDRAAQANFLGTSKDILAAHAVD